MKLNGLEFRSHEEGSLHPRHEIVKWSDDSSHCWTVAKFERDKEGYYLVSIGDRIFNDDIGCKDFYAIGKYAQKILDAKFELEEYKNEKL